MRIKLLIASLDAGYAGHLSAYISEHYADSIIVSVCSSYECLKAQDGVKYDVALLDADIADKVDIESIGLPVLMVEDIAAAPESLPQLERICKFQRITSITAELLTKFAKVSKHSLGTNSENAQITAVWSPAGGVGKTTVALSYAAKKVSEGKQVLYLNLEPFSSVPAYFHENGKSISAVFEMLDNSESNVRMLIRGICQQDRGVGVAYLCGPENFDDMYALSAENIAELTAVCAGVTQELVIDMSCVCDWRTRKVFELASKVFLVSDSSKTSQVKLLQFTSQHNVFENMKEKIVYVANKGAAAIEAAESILQLPLVYSSDPKAVYQTLSGCFE